MRKFLSVLVPELEQAASDSPRSARLECSRQDGGTDGSLANFVQLVNELVYFALSGQPFGYYGLGNVLQGQRTQEL